MTSMPLTFKISLFAFSGCALGAILLLAGHVAGGWSGMGISIWGMIIGGISLVAGSLFSFASAVSEPGWRRTSISMFLVSLSLIIAFLAKYH